MIFGTNAARLYRLKLKAAENAPMPAYSADRLAKLKSEYELAARNRPTCVTATSAPAEAPVRHAGAASSVVPFANAFASNFC